MAVTTAGRIPKLLIGRHVREALANRSPILAMESTVITHGLPEPQNFELAIALEKTVISTGDHQSNLRHLLGRGVTPATIGIVKGQLIVGLSHDEIEYLSQKERSKPIKASRRDLPIAVALGLSAGTTVSATMAIASSLKIESHSNVATDSAIKVFATGGLGGVHMGGELSMDISADLYEFARSPIGVVSSGFKSFLDCRRSLEFLETMGATVMSLDDSRAAAHDAEGLFPGFFTRKNKQNIKSPYIVRNVEEAARVLLECLEGPVSNKRALLLAVPIPAGPAELMDLQKNAVRYDDDNEQVDDDVILERALASASDEIDKRTDLEGKEKTPLILERLEKLTGGKSLEANMRLLRNNALVGAELALKYAQLSNRTGAVLEEDVLGTRSNTVKMTPLEDHLKGALNKETLLKTSHLKPLGDDDAGGAPIVVGCTMIDMHVSTRIDQHFKNNAARSGITFHGWPHLTLGGVGQNLATALHFLGHKPTFITSLANDNLASFALDQLHKRVGLSRNQLTVYQFAADQVVAQQAKLSEVSTCFALVLLDALDGQCEYVVANLEAVKAIDRRAIRAHELQIRRAPLLAMDANLMGETIELLLELAFESRKPTFIEPTDKCALPELVSCLQRLSRSERKSHWLSSILCMSPNIIELEAMLSLFEATDETQLTIGETPRRKSSQELSLGELEQMARRLMEVHLSQLKCLLVTLDKRGVLVAVRTTSAVWSEIENINLIDEFKQQQEGKINGSSIIRMQHFDAPKLIERPVSASGAGDSFAAGFISGLLNNSNLGQCLARAFESSFTALQDRNTISQGLKSLAQGNNDSEQL